MIQRAGIEEIYDPAIELDGHRPTNNKRLRQCW